MASTQPRRVTLAGTHDTVLVTYRGKGGKGFIRRNGKTISGVVVSYRWREKEPKMHIFYARRPNYDYAYRGANYL